MDTLANITSAADVLRGWPRDPSCSPSGRSAAGGGGRPHHPGAPSEHMTGCTWPGCRSSVTPTHAQSVISMVVGAMVDKPELSSSPAPRRQRRVARAAQDVLSVFQFPQLRVFVESLNSGLRHCGWLAGPGVGGPALARDGSLRPWHGLLTAGGAGGGRCTTQALSSGRPESCLCGSQLPTGNESIRIVVARCDSDADPMRRFRP
ncbi:unnamed protein product [Arctogadus glacialis]